MEDFVLVLSTWLIASFSLSKGTEYACVQGWGMFDGPTDDEAIDVMKEWHINVVRIPLNEACWLGINGVNFA